MKATKMMHELKKNENGSYSIISYRTKLVNEKLERDILKAVSLEPEEVPEAMAIMGISRDEVLYAVEEMELHGHTCASFGVNGGFVCSFNEEKVVH